MNKKSQPKNRPNTNSKIAKLLGVFLLVFIVSLIAGTAFYIYKNKNKQPQNEENKSIRQTSISQDAAEIEKKFEEKTKYFDEIHEPNITETTIETKPEIKNKEDLKDTKEDKKQEQKKDTKKIAHAKQSDAKLIIVIDDISLESQVDALSDLGYPINLSFLPPTASHPKSAQIAQKVSHSMIHLPLQATNFEHEESDTLKVGDNYEIIEAKIAEVRKLYPKAKYINNHTGSKFSQDKESTDKLLKAMAKYDFDFLDSKTASNSTLCESARTFKVKCLERNIFLDNEQNEKYIISQLAKAIEMAKKYGKSIAIGHPHKETIQALQNSKELLSQVKIVYIDNL